MFDNQYARITDNKIRKGEAEWSKGVVLEHLSQHGPERAISTPNSDPLTLLPISPSSPPLQ